VVGRLTYAGEVKPTLNSVALDSLEVGDRTEAVTSALKKGIIKL
jgi:hypothetical protein